MNKRDELQSTISKLNNELRDLIIADEIKEKKKMVGKYYQQWHDASEQYYEYVHILFIDEFGVLYGDVIKMYDWPNNNVHYAIQVTTVLDWRCNLRHSTEIKKEYFLEILQKFSDNLSFVQMKTFKMGSE